MRYLVLSGFHGSTGDHWIVHFLKQNPEAVLVQQDNWENPIKELWTNQLLTYLEHYKDEEIILVAHSMGAVTIAALFADQQLNFPNIKGALLVAPADSEQIDFPTEIQGYSPMPQAKLPFASTLMASTNDHYMTLERALFFAQKWGSTCVNYGAVGHVTTDSGFGEWKELTSFIETLF